MSDDFAGITPDPTTLEGWAVAVAEEWYGDPCPLQPDGERCMCWNCDNWWSVHDDVLEVLRRAIAQKLEKLASVIGMDYELGDLKMRDKVAKFLREEIPKP